MKKFIAVIQSQNDWKRVSEIAVKALKKYGEFDVTLSRVRRTLDQNAYFHVVCDRIAKFHLEEQGIACDMEGVKLELKEKFGYWNLIHKPNGEVVRVLRSTADYDIEEMRACIERIVMFYEQNFGIDDFDSKVKEFINNKEK